MGWVRFTGKGLEFIGKLVQAEGFESWAKSKGEQIVTSLGLKGGGYALGLGKNRKARKEIWSELQNLAESSPELGSSINEVAAQYTQLLSKLAQQYTKLPHQDLDLCVVPRVLLNRDALVAAKINLQNSQELANLKGGPAFRTYFIEELVSQMDEALSREAEKATPAQPLDLGDKWVVGFSPKYEWCGTRGHYFVYWSSLRTAPNATPAQRQKGKEDSDKMLKKCQAWLGRLSDAERKTLEANFP